MGQGIAGNRVTGLHLELAGRLSEVGRGLGSAWQGAGKGFFLSTAKGDGQSFGSRAGLGQGTGNPKAMRENDFPFYGFCSVIG